jgi:Uma2 family endonuclease
MTALEALNVPHAAKLKVRDFMVLHDSGAFAEFAKSELIEGKIWVMNSIYSRHAGATAEMVFALRLAVNAACPDLKLYTPLSVDLSDDSLPEPDIALCEPHASGPMPLAKVRLLIEVSDTTLDIDLGRKAALYARCGVPEYWVVDVEGKIIHQHWAPGPEGYAERREIGFGRQILGATLGGVVVETVGLG